MRRDRRLACAGMLLCFVLLLTVAMSGEAQAVGGFTDARNFYQSEGTGKKHVLADRGNIYLATLYDLRWSKQELRYTPVGYDVQLSGGGRSLSFSVTKGGSLAEVPETSIGNGGLLYELHCLDSADINRLAQAADKDAADAILGSRFVDVRMDAIFVLGMGKEMNGSIEEDGKGGLREQGEVWHLREDGVTEQLKAKFPGQEISSYQGIEARIDNHMLTLSYGLSGGSVSNGYGSEAGMLTRGGEKVQTATRLLQQAWLPNPDEIGLTKQGYHLEDGKEWEVERHFFDAATAYMPKEIDEGAGVGDVGRTMYPAWKANHYTVRYDPCGGVGSMGETQFTYDSPMSLNRIGFTKAGHRFVGWNTAQNGSGATYQDGEVVQNLTQEKDGIVTLYAQWEPESYAIGVERQGGEGGTGLFYERYGHGWHLDADGSMITDALVVPARVGYEFLGYYTGIGGGGTMVADAHGKLVAPTDLFLRDSTVYASWKPKEHTLSFDRQGGEGGPDSLTAIYGAALPPASAPVRTGYHFRGYYTQPNGGGERYYAESMGECLRFGVDGDVTLYAYWVDDIAPEVTLTANAGGWSNREIELTATASDYGSGMAALELYEGDRKVSGNANMETPAKWTLSLVNGEEGAIRYRARGVDRDGNEADAWLTVYYDITAPKGEVLSDGFDGRNFEIEVFVDDWNVR